MWQTILGLLAAKGKNDTQQSPTIENVFSPGQIDLNKQQQGQLTWPQH
nr:MAG TPA: hypothetical protein [Caudoviricetes sp.]